METHKPIYCLDANFFIEGWRKYYAPDFCSSYWDVIDKLAQTGTLLITQEVQKEIFKIDDDLKDWIKSRKHITKATDEKVQQNLRKIFSTSPDHQYLVNNYKHRSIADPWVIAHAMSEGATVVTKEQASASKNPRKIKIPDVCANMNVRCIDDFTFIREVGISFECTVRQ